MQTDKDIQPLKVFINALHSKSGGGITYISNIIPLLARRSDLDIHICFNRTQLPLFPQLFEFLPQTGQFQCILPNVKVHIVDFRHTFWQTLLFEQFKIPFLVHKINVDVTFSPANYGPIFVPRAVLLLRNALSVAFVERRVFKRLYWVFLYLGTLLSVFTANRVISVSHYAKKASIGVFEKCFPAKFSIVPHGVSRIFQPSSFELRSETEILVVSDIYVQKNLHTLLKALSLVIKEKPSTKLQIVGRPVDMNYFEELHDLTSALKIEDCVTFVGEVGIKRLCELYQRCAVFVFPSTVETFGNPLLEALASGAPVACSRIPATLEVAGDAAKYFDPLYIEGIADVLLEMLSDPVKRKQLSHIASDRAKKFSWDQAAKDTADVFRVAAVKE